MNALRRLSSGVRASTTNRDDEFSAWHRTIGRDLYMTDVDAVEYRIEAGKLRIAAILELKAWSVTDPDHIRNSNNIVKLKLAEALGVPFLHIWTDFKNDRFLIWNVSRTGLMCDYFREAVELTAEELKILLSKL